MFSAHNWQSGLGSQALSNPVSRRVQRLRLTLTVSVLLIYAFALPRSPPNLQSPPYFPIRVLFSHPGLDITEQHGCINKAQSQNIISMPRKAIMWLFFPAQEYSVLLQLYQCFSNKLGRQSYAGGNLERLLIKFYFEKKIRIFVIENVNYVVWWLLINFESKE